MGKISPDLELDHSRYICIVNFFKSYKTAPQKRKDSWNLYIISPTAFWGVGNFFILKCHFVTFNSATVLLLCRVSFQFIVLYIMYMIYYISLWCITRFLNTTECCTLQSQPDLAGYAAPHSINLQEEQPLWPLPKASLEI